jgi:hypothetical protein
LNIVLIGDVQNGRRTAGEVEVPHHIRATAVQISGGLENKTISGVEGDGAARQKAAHTVRQTVFDKLDAGIAANGHKANGGRMERGHQHCAGNAGENYFFEIIFHIFLVVYLIIGFLF